MKDFSVEEYLEDLRQLCAIDSGHLNGPGAEAVADFFEVRYQDAEKPEEVISHEN